MPFLGEPDGNAYSGTAIRYEFTGCLEFSHFQPKELRQMKSNQKLNETKKRNILHGQETS